MRRRMILVVGVQVLFGLTMAVFGLLKFIKPDIKVQDDVTLQSFIDTGWLWQLVGAAELVGGLAVASGLLVPLGLIVLTPVVLGIAAFAFKTGGDEASVGFVVLALHLFLCWRWRSAFRPLFRVGRVPGDPAQLPV